MRCFNEYALPFLYALVFKGKEADTSRPYLNMARLLLWEQHVLEAVCLRYTAQSCIAFTLFGFLFGEFAPRNTTPRSYLNNIYCQVCIMYYLCVVAPNGPPKCTGQNVTLNV